MEYLRTEANKRISRGGEANNVCTGRIALHVATDVWKRAGLARSMRQKAGISYYCYYSSGETIRIRAICNAFP